MDFYSKLILRNEISLLPKPSRFFIFLLKEVNGLIVLADWDRTVKHIFRKLLVILWVFLSNWKNDTKYWTKTL